MNNWYTHEEIKFKLLIRRHLEDHIIWLRSYMVSLLDDLPDLKYVEERLAKNHDSLMNCMREFYGDSLADNLIAIGKDFIVSIMNLLKSIKAGDNASIPSIETDLITHAENISNTLSIANPYYSKDELTDLYKTSLVLIKYEFMARTDGDYNADIVYFDMLIHHASVLADYITNGIIERFFESHTIRLDQEQYQDQVDMYQEDILQSQTED